MIDPDLRFCSQVLSLSVSKKIEKIKSDYANATILISTGVKNFLNSLKCKYRISNSKPWKLGRNWMIRGLKLERDTSKGKTMHYGETSKCPRLFKKIL